MLLLGIALGMSKGEAGAVVKAEAGGRAFRPWKTLRAFSRRAFSSKALTTLQAPAIVAEEPLEPDALAEAPAIAEVTSVEARTNH